LGQLPQGFWASHHGGARLRPRQAASGNLLIAKISAKRRPLHISSPSAVTELTAPGSMHPHFYPLHPELFLGLRARAFERTGQGVFRQFAVGTRPRAGGVRDGKVY
jgi:hypothetical protein